MTLLSNLYPNIKGAQGVQGIQGTSTGTQGTQGIQGIQGGISGFNVTNVTSPYTLQTTDVGSLISINSGVSTVSISSNTFSFGNSFMIYNGTSTQQSIVAGTGVSFYSGDGTTDVYGRKYLEENDLTTILCSSNNDEFIFSTPLSGVLSIVTTGLILYLDAGDSSSYPGSGTTWYDLSGSGNDATLVNGPTYASAYGGAIVFDGIDDYASLFTQINSDIDLTDVTISFWAYIEPTASDEVFVSMETLVGNVPLAIWYDRSAFSRDNTGTGDVGGGTVNVIAVMVTDASSERRFTTSDNALSAATWYNISVVLDVTNNAFYTYINGVEEAKWVSTNTSGGINSTVNDFRIAGGTPYLDGRVSNFLVYTKALSASEIQQNFDALKGRYGL